MGQVLKYVIVIKVFVSNVFFFMVLGDIAFRFLNYVEKSKCSAGCHVTVFDINKYMLDVGKIRGKRLNYDSKVIDWVEGDAEKLPFPDESFNAYTVAFGIRNVTRMNKVFEIVFNISIHLVLLLCLIIIAFVVIFVCLFCFLSIALTSFVPWFCISFSPQL